MKRRASNRSAPQDSRLKRPGVSLDSLSFLTTVPVHLLSLVFEYIPLHPLLGVVSLVCKRWRHAALLSIPASCPSTRTHISEALALLPNVSTLALVQPPPGLLLPASIHRVQRLILRHVGFCQKGDNCGAMPFTSLTSLTDLDVSIDCEHTTLLLLGSQTSLTRLTLRQHARERVSGFPKEFPLYFPALRQLRLLDSVRETLQYEILSKHASQLTHLICPSMLGGLAFPKLHELICSTGDDIPLPVCARLEISCRFANGGKLSVPDPSSLRAIAVIVQENVHSELLLLALRKFSNLTALLLMANTEDRTLPQLAELLPTLLPCLPHLRELRVAGSPDLSHVTALMLPSLTALRCDIACNIDPSALPNVARLHVCISSALGKSLVRLRRHLEASPKLRVMRLAIKTRSVPAKQLHEFLALCEARGMEEVMLELENATPMHFRWLNVQCVPPTSDPLS